MTLAMALSSDSFTNAIFIKAHRLAEVIRRLLHHLLDKQAISQI